MPAATMDPSGATSETVLEVVIREKDEYAVRLNYPYDRKTISNRNAVWAAAGGSVSNDAEKWQERGAPFDVETKVLNLAGGYYDGSNTL